MRLRGGYIEGAAEKGGDANVEKRQELSEKQEEFCRRQDNRRSRAADWVFQGIWLEADAEGAYPKGN